MRNSPWFGLLGIGALLVGCAALPAREAPAPQPVGRVQPPPGQTSTAMGGRAEKLAAIRMLLRRASDAAVPEASAEQHAAKYELLVEIGTAQFRVGDEAGALTTFDQAAETGVWGSEHVSVQIGIARAEAGEVGEALRIAASRRNRRDQDRIYEKVASAQAAAGDLAGSLRTATIIEHADLRVGALVKIAHAQAKERDQAAAQPTFEQILKAAATLGKVGSSLALPGVAAAQAGLGNLAEALQTVTRIEEEELRLLTLVRIAWVRVEAGDPVGAGTALVHAWETAATLPVHSRAHLLPWIAFAQAGAGDPGGAATTLQEALRMVTVLETDADKASALLSIVTAQAAAGDLVGARRTAAALTGRDARDALLSIAAAQAKTGDVIGALQAAGRIESKSPLDRLFVGRVAVAWAKAGEVDPALAWADRLGSPMARAQALLGIAAGIWRRIEAKSFLSDAGWDDD